MSVSDIVVDGELPQSLRDRLDAWAGCIAGALEESDYLSRIHKAGFEEIEVLSRDYVDIGSAADWEDAKALLAGISLSPRDLQHKVASVQISSRKPA
jgi:hypothetical protein